MGWTELDDKCEECAGVYYSYFCGYNARYCKIHGLIDCNPDSYVEELKKNKQECPNFVKNSLKKSFNDWRF